MERSCNAPLGCLVGEGAVLVVDVERVRVERSEQEDVVEPVVVEIFGDSSTGHCGVALEWGVVVECGQTGFHSLVTEVEQWFAGEGCGGKCRERNQHERGAWG